MLYWLFGLNLITLGCIYWQAARIDALRQRLADLEGATRRHGLDCSLERNHAGDCRHIEQFTVEGLEPPLCRGVFLRVREQRVN